MFSIVFLIVSIPFFWDFLMFLFLCSSFPCVFLIVSILFSSTLCFLCSTLIWTGGSLRFVHGVRSIHSMNPSSPYVFYGFPHRLYSFFLVFPCVFYGLLIVSIAFSLVFLMFSLVFLLFSFCFYCFFYCLLLFFWQFLFVFLLRLPCAFYCFLVLVSLRLVSFFSRFPYVFSCLSIVFLAFVLLFSIGFPMFLLFFYNWFPSVL